MDPQVGSMMRNISTFWTMSYMISMYVLLANRKQILRHPLLGLLNGILTVTYSMEVGACICYLWARHSCQGFILMENWMNWLTVVLFFGCFTFSGMIILKKRPHYFGFYFMVLIFSVNFNTIENIVFLLPVLRLLLAGIQFDFITG